jgi:hypothetical protein
MKASFVLTLAVGTTAFAAMVGCTRTIERQVPVAASQPSVVTTPAIIEREKSMSSASGATAGSCMWASQQFSSGATSCQNHMTYKCNSGTWEQLSTPAC